MIFAVHQFVNSNFAKRSIGINRTFSNKNPNPRKNEVIVLYFKLNKTILSIRYLRYPSLKKIECLKYVQKYKIYKC